MPKDQAAGRFLISTGNQEIAGGQPLAIAIELKSDRALIDWQGAPNASERAVALPRDPVVLRDVAQVLAAFAHEIDGQEDSADQ